MVDNEHVLNHPHDQGRATTHVTMCCRPIHALSSDRYQAAPSETIYAKMHRYHSWRWTSSSQIRRRPRSGTRNTRLQVHVRRDGRKTKDCTHRPHARRRIRSIRRVVATCRCPPLACTEAMVRMGASLMWSACGRCTSLVFPPLVSRSPRVVYLPSLRSPSVFTTFACLSSHAT